MKKILLTAFEPFGGNYLNSSLEVVKKVEFSDVEIVKETLPVVYKKEMFLELLKKHKPDIMLLCGQAGGRTNVDLEQVAINLMYSASPDNEGVIKKGEKIVADGADAYFASIPTMEVVSKLEKDYPVRLSLSAGGYICNFGFYASIFYAKKLNLDTKIGFIHFPFFESQVEDDKYPKLKLELMVECLHKIIKEIL